jgi:hypothetical protein
MTAQTSVTTGADVRVEAADKAPNIGEAAAWW